MHRLNPDPLDLIHGDLVAAPVIKPRRFRIGMRGRGDILVLADTGGLNVLPQPVLQVVLARHFMVLAAFFV